ncbi:MAG TPA: ATP-dependent helicase C-terminal domain-containing protein [Anaeromyxobacteraceae bacterium]|nr:ATP-dependent helicase C-terminal domain-containing protein [Anaeromyxobacteraceae bacterium]
MQPLPIDPLLPEVVAALRRSPALVIEAPPGAGKTTRVPRALLEAGLCGEGQVVVLEPRRLAARLAARRVAEEMGERVGGTVGYQVRFEEVAGPRTRLRYVTEGLLTRRLVSDPRLAGVGAVVLDEFHERHLPGDLALGFLKRLQAEERPDLKVVAMSATLDAGPVARFLSAPSLRSEGRLFEVAIEYLSPAEAARGDRLEDLVAAAVRRLVREALEGDVLVFLPGAAEIRRSGEALEGTARQAGLDLLPLHGDLPPGEQDRAVRPGPRRKVILSTNVAETSVTIEGVAAVVDSGLARVASHSPWSGLPRLEVRRVSRASAAQRAGRAGRTRPGRAIRLYTRHDHDSRPEYDLPEVAREDLCEPFLALAALGALDGFPWFEPPPAAAAEAARALLSRLGAVDPRGAVTDLGRRMLRFPLHPRLSRLVCEAEDRRAAEAGAVLAALLGERDIRERALDRRGPGAPPTGPSDLLELAHLFEEAARARFAEGRLRALGLAPGPVQAVERARRQLVHILRPDRSRPKAATPTAASSPAPPSTRNPVSTAGEDALLLSTLAAYPDRVARRRDPGSAEVVLCGGGSARLGEESVVREAPLLVAVDAEERRGDRRAPGAPVAGRGGQVVVRLASAATPEMLLELFPGALRFEEEVRWNAQAERVEAVEQLRYQDLALEETRKASPDPEKAAALLAEAAQKQGARAFAEEGAVDRLQSRIAFAARALPEAGLSAPGEEDLAAALRELCAGRRSFAELREAGLVESLLSRLGGRERALLDRAAPERVTLPGGRAVRVHYEPGGKPPWIESRLQDFFGMARGPVLAEGRVPLTLHLLAPNQRAVQVTSDLTGFWERHYPSLRRELSRRYPRHAWPEDPLRAEPPRRR